MSVYFDTPKHRLARNGVLQERKPHRGGVGRGRSARRTEIRPPSVSSMEFKRGKAGDMFKPAREMGKLAPAICHTKPNPSADTVSSKTRLPRPFAPED